MKYAIIINYWNRQEVKLFENREDAEMTWGKICSHKHARKSNGGKNVRISDPKQGGVGIIYSTIDYQKSWED